MAYELFFMPLLSSFVIAAIIISAFVFSVKKTHDGARSSDRHIHRPGVSRFGGVALIISFVSALLFDRHLAGSASLSALFVGCMLILFFGVLDDLRQLDWKLQLLFQIAMIALVYFIGLRLEFISNPFGGIFLFENASGFFMGLAVSTIWIAFLMNAMNWIDGVDGVSGGVTLIGAVTIFFLSLRPEVNQPPVAIITAALVGCLTALLIFNFYPSKIMAGTSGSMFMGFALASLAIFAGAKIATTFLVMAIPVIDAIWVIGERLGAKKSIFSPDKRHLHFRLLQIGWSQRKICLFYWGITVLIAIAALNTRAIGKSITFILIFVLMLAILFLIRKKAMSVEKLPYYE